jgi:hypothetical protein
MKDQLLKYLKEKFKNARIDEQEMGTVEKGSYWVDIYSGSLVLEIVIYIQENTIGVSQLNNKTIPFTGHDNLFNTIEETIKYIEMLTNSQDL